ncbi:methyl-accepting chemotaxis protein 2 [Desulfosporosinus acididurans]|uniref:Methyl-accepting chemotaxis protein 2 n=1 Tax=Desulfosporosinus acididurans TaxID=476652 RepID=A0A0J1FND3_9FIRM|nr:methyl-accepting chemotaxis protein [Desulfosporosinus acididurans]KLU64980.1 methyl-accepting chemotaxis protein 2 [Desulfosporosinus acididurans]
MGLFKGKSSEILTPNSDCEKMYKALSQSDFTRSLEVDIETSSPLYPVVEILNRVIAERQEASSASLKDIDNSVKRLISMTSIRQMLHKVEEQADHLTSLAAQSEELGASSDQVAQSATNSSGFVEQATTAAVSGGEKIQEAILFVERSFDEFSIVSRQVQEVLNSMKDIEKIVTVIAGVADQTNLLALNAAIEAARAGEQGRGFAVVADEVRKLAEHTTTSVTDIHQKIAVLSQSSFETNQKIVTLSQTMYNGKTIMQEAASSLEGIIENFTSITEDIQNIAASSEEQSAAVQEAAGSISTLTLAAEEIKNIAEVTGQGIYDLSRDLETIRSEEVTRVPNMSDYQALELCKTDHLLWTWRIYNLLLGYEHLTAKQIGDHHDCRLGQWVESSHSLHFRSSNVLTKLEAPHKLVHELAREAAAAIEQGDKTRGGQLLREMAQASQEVVAVLQELQQGC